MKRHTWEVNNENGRFTDRGWFTGEEIKHMWEASQNPSNGEWCVAYGPRDQGERTFEKEHEQNRKYVARKKLVNKFKRVLLDQCLEAARAERVFIADLYQYLKLELKAHDLDDRIYPSEVEEIRDIVKGAGFSETPDRTTYIK